MKTKRESLVRLGAGWCDMLDGTELGDGLSSWGSSERYFSKVLVESDVQGSVTHAFDSSDDSEAEEEDGDDFLWEMAALGLGDEGQETYPLDSGESESDTDLAPPAKRKRPL